MKNKYFVFAPEGCGFEQFETEAEAIKCMEAEQKEMKKEANNDGEWPLYSETAIMGSRIYETKRQNKITAIRSYERAANATPNRDSPVYRYL